MSCEHAWCWPSWPPDSARAGTAVGGKTQLFFFSSQTAPWLLVNIAGTVQLETFYGPTST